MAAYPYTPTRILGSPNDDTIFYIFSASSTSQSSPELRILNATETINTTGLPFTPLSSAPPFLSTAGPETYVPAIGDDGNILVLTGDCRNASQESALWRYQTNNGTTIANGTWTQLGLELENTADNAELKSANYLASGIAFSTSPNATSQLYVFGGMCPNDTTSTSTDWIKAAEYSNSMLTFESKGASSPTSEYQLGVSSTKGPPVAEAGYSITALQPTFTQSSSDNETRQQNQNYVLIGGHTQSAFINMSQVALFSLPEQGWSFLPVDQPPSSPRTDLAARTTSVVDPRSGHTAVLTSDGKQIVVFGGWVGDVNTQADPQVAILAVGQGYGGDGDWQWNTADESGPGPSGDGGIYGHGAIMLPGNVMMISGGYTIPGTTSKRRRRADPTASTDSYFFNVTSSSWTTSYTHPKIAAVHAGKSNKDADRMTARRRVGLGAGLTFGIIAILIIVVIYFWYSRQLKRRRDAHEAELQGLAETARGANEALVGQSLGGQEMTSRDAYSVTRDISGGRGYHDNGAERSGLLFEIPSPTRGLRRSLHSRGAYQPAPRYDDGRLARGSGNIHPIDERDEYDEDTTERGPSAEPDLKDGDILRSAPPLDPFGDPEDRSPSPKTPARERELEVQKWVHDWAAADALMHHHAGRHSPDKTDRTSSTLSDQSVRSAVSAQSWQHSGGAMSRSISQRSAALFSSRPLDINTQRQPTDLLRTQSVNRSPSFNNQRSQSLTLYPRRTNTPDTYATATTSVSQLQSEGEALLGGYLGRTPSSPTRTQSRARNWMGSVRRVFTGIERSNSASPENGELSTSSSPTKYHHTDAGVPRRAASTGTMLWQKRQGAKDWETDGTANQGQESKRNNHGAEEEEWDVESAVERRVVQVMFTVPKEKLRVVNRGPDGDGISMVSRESSVKDTTTAQEGKGKGKAKEQDSDA